MYPPTALPTPHTETNGAEISAVRSCSLASAAASQGRLSLRESRFFRGAKDDTRSPSRSISVLACALRAKPLLVLAALAILFALTGEAQAGLLVTTDQSSSLQAAGDEATPAVPEEATPLDRHHREHVSESSQDALPTGTGAGGSGVSSGTSVTAVLDAPCAPISPSALSASLEERHLSLPASPVFDRLRPPRVG